MLTKADVDRIVQEAREQGWNVTHIGDHYIEASIGRWTHSQRFWITDRETWFRLSQKVRELQFIAEEAERKGIEIVGIVKHGNGLRLEIRVPKDTPGFFDRDEIGHHFIGGLTAWKKHTSDFIEGSVVLDDNLLEAGDG